MTETETKAPRIANWGIAKNYGFPDMDVEESQFIEGEKLNGSVYAAAMNYGRKVGKRFKGKTEETGLRLTRVE